VPVPVDLIRQINRLDPMPVSMQRLMKTLQNDDIGAAQIATYVEYDPAMAAVVLRQANSAAYGGSRPTVSLREAVLRLGKANILHIVLGGTLKAMKAKVPMYGLGEDELWLHSAAASVAVKALQHERPGARVPDSAAVAALLHDIGKLVMGRYMKADALAILDLAAEQRLTFVAAERELLGCDHTEVGAALCRHWGLPDDITLAIEHHHDETLVDPTPTMDAVMVANVVAKCVGAGLGAEGLNMTVDGGSMKRLGLYSAGYSRVILQTLTWLNELKTTYPAAA
jgi:putative nucleotidyltransferase with HDIG domain